MKHSSDYLKCPSDDAQMGAGFGICGVIYILLSAMHVIKQLQHNKLVSKVRETLTKIVSYIEQRGCLPKYEDGDADFTKVKLDFTDGISGVIPMLALAASSWDVFDTAFRGRLQNAAV